MMASELEDVIGLCSLEAGYYAFILDPDCALINNSVALFCWVPVRHSQSTPPPGRAIIFGIQTFRPPYPFSQIPTRIAPHETENNSCASIEAGLTKIIILLLDRS